MKRMFYPGERVILIGDTAGGAHDIMPKGATGTILRQMLSKPLRGAGKSTLWFSVRWDQHCLPRLGHSCNGLCPKGTGWNVSETEIELLVEETEEEQAIDVEDLL